MSKPAPWRDVKAKAQQSDPTWDAPERIARRTRMREEMRATVGGAHHWPPSNSHNALHQPPYWRHLFRRRCE
jgi:hypothetical protein